MPWAARAFSIWGSRWAARPLPALATVDLREGTVIRSWLLDLAVNALDEDEHLDELRGFAQDSGEGRWTVEAALDNAVPLPAITASLFARFASRQEDSPQMKMIAALRNQFGGHAIKATKEREDHPAF